MEIFLTYLKVFACGGLLCLIAQIFVVRTKITPARILTLFLMAGVLLEAVGVFKYISDFGGAGVTVPILGFGASLAKGAIEGARTKGILGAFSGGLEKTAAGLGVTIALSYLVAVIFKPRTKKH